MCLRTITTMASARKGLSQGHVSPRARPSSLYFLVSSFTACLELASFSSYDKTDVLCNILNITCSLFHDQIEFVFAQILLCLIYSAFLFLCLVFKKSFKLHLEYPFAVDKDLSLSDQTPRSGPLLLGPSHFMPLIAI